MTTRYVSYCLPYKLPCANASRKDVILCLQSEDLIVQPSPPCSLPVTTIEAQVCQAYTTCTSCTSTIWNYKFSYDDTQLTNPTTPLIGAAIVGVVCVDCMTDWILQHIACDTS